jgi:RND family efflux transporter MFP subunit
MAKAKALIKRHPAWTTLMIVVLAGVFMGAKWINPSKEDDRLMQFTPVKRGDLRITVAEGGALDSTSKLSLRCELDSGGTIVSLVDEGTYVKGPIQHQSEQGDTLETIAKTYGLRAVVPASGVSSNLAEHNAFMEAIKRANPDVNWDGLVVGQTIQIPGDLLVKFEDGVLREKQLTQKKGVIDAERDLGNAVKDRELRKLETASSNKQAALDTEFSKQDVDRYTEGDAPLRILSLEGDIDLAEEEIKRAQERLASTKKLQEKGYATSLEVQADELTIKKHQNLITKYKTQKQLYLKFDQPQMQKRLEAKYEQAQLEEHRTLQKSRTLVEAMESLVQRREEGLKSQNERLALYRDQLTKTEVRASQDGLVIYPRSSSRSNDSYIKEGVLVKKGNTILDLPDISELMAVVQVHESFVRQLRTGQEAVVRIDSLPDKTFRGIVNYVAPTPDGFRTYYENISVYNTHVWIQDEDNQLPKDLKPGVSAKAEILVNELKDVLMVPVQSVTSHKGMKVVQIKQDGIVKVIPVKTGQFNNRFIEIKKGLEEGDQVSLSPEIDENEGSNISKPPRSSNKLFKAVGS